MTGPRSVGAVGFGEKARGVVRVWGRVGSAVLRGVQGGWHWGMVDGAAGLRVGPPGGRLHGREDDGHVDHPGHGRDVGTGLEVVPEVAADDVLEDERVGAEEPGAQDLVWQLRPDGQGATEHRQVRPRLRLEHEDPPEAQQQGGEQHRGEGLGVRPQGAPLVDEVEGADRGLPVDRFELLAVQVVLGVDAQLAVVLLPDLVVAGVLRRGREVAVLVDVQPEQVEHVLVVDALALVLQELELELAGEERQQGGSDQLEQHHAALVDDDRRHQHGDDAGEEQHR
jgi:hypothetical protein